MNENPKKNRESLSDLFDLINENDLLSRYSSRTILLWAFLDSYEELLSCGGEVNEPDGLHAEQITFAIGSTFQKDFSEFQKIANSNPQELYKLYIMMNRMPCGPGSHKCSCEGGCLGIIMRFAKSAFEKINDVELILAVNGFYKKENGNPVDWVPTSKEHFDILDDAGISVVFLNGKPVGKRINMLSAILKMSCFHRDGNKQLGLRKCANRNLKLGYPIRTFPQMPPFHSPNPSTLQDIPDFNSKVRYQ